MLVILLVAGLVPQARAGLPVHDSRQDDALDRANRAPGAGYPLGMGESVSTWNGNLHLEHAGGPGYVLPWGFPLAVNRVYDSQRVHFDRVQTGADGSTPELTDYLSGRSWVGLGWMLHLGRIWRSREYVWDGSGTLYYGQGSAVHEDPGGALVRFEPSYPLAQPKVRYEYYEDCSDGPSDPPPYCDRHPDYPQCDPDLDPCSSRPPGDPEHWDIVYPDGTRYRLERLVEDELLTGGWLKNHDRAGSYVTRITGVGGHEITVRYHYSECIEACGDDEECRSTCEAKYPFHEAIASIESGDYRLEFTVYEDSDGVPSELVGMLKEVRAVTVPADGPSGPKEVAYRYEYDLVPVPDGSGGSVNVALLRRVVVTGSDGTDGGVTEYLYGSEPEQGIGSVGDLPLLREVRYPLGAVTHFEYGSWTSGNREGDGLVPGGPREVTGVVRRELYPEGTGAGKRRATWSWTRRFAVASCADSDLLDLDQEYRLELPDGTARQWTFDGHPCGDESDDWGPIGRTRTFMEFGGDGQLLRKTAYSWDYRRDEEGRIVRVLAQEARTSWLDDEGACFGDGEPDGTARSTTSRWSERNDWDFWKRQEVSGDFLPVGAAWVSWTDWEGSDDAEDCRKQNHVIGAWRFREVSYDGWKRRETVEFDCRGNIVHREQPQSWEALPAGEENAVGGALVLDVTLDGSNRETERTLSGGDGEATYTTRWTWADEENAHRTRTTSSPAVEWSLAREEFDSLGNLLRVEDANGLGTRYERDALGRPTAILPDESPGQRIVRPDLQHVRIVVSPDGSAEEYDAADPGMAFTETELDGLGRPRLVRRSRPDGGVEVQVTRYDALGRAVFVSAWMREEDWTAAPRERWESADGTWFVTDVPLQADGTPWGTVSWYGEPDPSAPDNPLRITADALGRVHRRRMADGTVLLRDYCGLHDRIGPEAPGGGLDASRATTRYRDAFGRLVVVDAPAGSADAVYTWGANGELLGVKLLEDVGSDAYGRWRSGELDAADGQERRFRYDAAGRLEWREDPERGRQTYGSHDAAGLPLAWQDENAAQRGFFFRARYDGLGRLTALEKVRGVPGAPEESDIDRLAGDGGFESGWGGWRRGRIEDGEFVEDAGNCYWKLRSYDDLPFEPPPGETGGHALVFTNDAGTDYGDAPPGPHAVLHAASAVTRDDVLTLSFWRQVREADSGRDALRVYVGMGDGSDLSGRRLVLELDAGVSSWARWRRWIDVRPADLFSTTEWPEGEARDIYVLLVFEKGDEEASGLGFGVAVDEVFLGRRGVEVLLEKDWDEDHCGAGTVAAEACADAENTGRVHGRLTTLTSFAGGRPVARRRYVYGGLAGRPSAVEDWLDWTGAATVAGEGGATWVANFTWDEQGGLSEWSAPRLPGVEAERRYVATYRHGYLAGLEVGDGTRILDPDADPPAVEYGAGAVLRALRYGNGTETVFQRDALGRIASILVTGPDGSGGSRTLWDTGAYRYDWQGNIVGIANLSYEYDAAGRLVRAEVAPQARNQMADPDVEDTLQPVTYSYDPWGNLSGRDWLGDGVENPDAPAGLEVFGRTIDPATNRVLDEGFAYDPAGRLVRFPGKAGQDVAALWTDTGRLRGFVEGDPGAGGRPDEIYYYDGSGNRFARVPVGRHGNPVLTLRDLAGQALCDYEVAPGADPRLTRDYLYALGRVVAERVVVHEAPHLMSTALGDADEGYGFTVPGGQPGENWELDIETRSGYRNWLTNLHPDAEGRLLVGEYEFRAGETNFVRARRIEPAETERSVAVSVSFAGDVPPGAANQVRSISVTRDGARITVRWRLATPNGKPFRVYFERESDGQVLVLTPQPLSAEARELVLEDQALASFCGRFWLTQLEVGLDGTVTGESDPGPAAELPSSRPGGGNPVNPCDPPGPGPGEELVSYAFVLHYQHRDHLGSVRVVTGEGGLEESATDWWPYGLEMIPEGESALALTRKKYTGHERDEETGLDWMFARYKAARFGFFLSLDPVDDVDLAVPISWNKYAYVRLNPVTLWDPLGLATNPNCKDEDHNGIDDVTGKPCGGGGAGACVSADPETMMCGIVNGKCQCRLLPPEEVTVWGGWTLNTMTISIVGSSWSRIKRLGFGSFGGGLFGKAKGWVKKAMEWRWEVPCPKAPEWLQRAASWIPGSADFWGQKVVTIADSLAVGFSVAFDFGTLVGADWGATVGAAGGPLGAVGGAVAGGITARKANFWFQLTFAGVSTTGALIAAGKTGKFTADTWNTLGLDAASVATFWAPVGGSVVSGIALRNDMVVSSGTGTGWPFACAGD